MTDGRPGDRRASTGRVRVPQRPSRLRTLISALRKGLYRPLAGDDDRVAYWVRHVRNGVLLTEIAALSVIGYVMLTDTPGRHHPVILAMAGTVVLTIPGLLLLPLPAMMRDSRGPTLFYAWSVATTILIGVAARLDGGSSSPLAGLLFVTLTYMAIAYSPYGVVAMGTVMTASYVLLVELPTVEVSGLFFVSILASITIICALASANSWAAYERQVLLIRTQETLALTDPLTGVPNRRAFVQRVTRAVDDAAWGHRAVVCLVDLDGFKGVNDAGGHAAGDELLRAVGSALGAAVRETDTVARLGGDEFAVLADATADVSGELLAERLRAAVSRVGAGRGVTASVGVADVEPGDSVEDLMHRADAAMYRSKTAGGDQVTALAY